MAADTPVSTLDAPGPVGRRRDDRRHEIRLVVILAAICLLVFFFRLGARPLWDTDEGMHAATAKDMVLTGDWITPRHNGEPFYDKPPLLNWLTALSFEAFGFTELAARLPAALLGLGCVAVTYLLGRKIYGPTTAFFGAVILATSAGFVVLTRAVVHDICLAFFVTLTLFLFYAGLEDGAKGRRWFLTGYAAVGFAVLAKGPVGVLLPGVSKGRRRTEPRPLYAAVRSGDSSPVSPPPRGTTPWPGSRSTWLRRQ